MIRDLYMHAELGRMIRTAREKRGVGLRELAKLIDVSPPFLSDVERGRRRPNPVIIANIAGALGLTDTEHRRWHVFGARGDGWLV